MPWRLGAARESQMAVRASREHWGRAERLRTDKQHADPLVVFTAAQVMQLTGLSRRQLAYWDKAGFYSPEYALVVPRGPYGRIYRFRDVVGLRALSSLRNEYHIPYRVLRKVGEWLKKHEGDPWSSVRFIVIGRDVSFEDPNSGGRLRSRLPPLAVPPIELQAIEDEMRARALQLRDRAPDEIGKITRHRYVVSNAWVLGGTRVPTEAIWRFYAAGCEPEVILAAYPSLTRIDVSMAISFEQQRRLSRRIG
jgi:uncharacterized protein (DUF433 family)